jgi:predicted permease
MMNGLWQDLRQATRSLIRSPLISVIAVITLALGIGANTAIYTVLDATLLSPPPYAEPDRLVAVWGNLPKRDIDQWPASPAMVDRYQRFAELYEGFAGGSGAGHIFQKQPGAQPEQTTSTVVTWNMLKVLGISPLIGRDFNELDGAYSRADVLPGAQPPFDTFNPPSTVILSHAFWQTRFGGDPAVVGSTIYLDSLPVTIAGVTPPGFQLLLPGGGEAEPDMLEALRADISDAPGINVFMSVIGRMRPDVSLAQAQAEMNAITTRLIENDAVYLTGNFHNRIVPLQEELTEDIAPVVWMLTGAVSLILLIACANVANLLLVRATSRRRDIAIQLALGCTRERLFRYGLVEAGLLSLVGGALGLAVAAVALPVLIAMQPQNLPQLSTIGIDFGILGYAFAVVTLVTLLAGSVPAAVSVRRDVSGHLKDRSGQQETRGSGRWRNALVVGEVALSFALLVGAGLMLRSFVELTSRDPGFNPEQVITFGYNLPNQRYPGVEEQAAFHKAFGERLKALPGAVTVGGAFPLPLAGQNFGSRYAPDLATFDDGSARQAQYGITYPGYFEALQASLLAGRTFNDADQAGARNFAVVNEALAQRAWPNESAIGKPLYIRRGDRSEAAELEVIGVIRHISQNTLDEEPREAVYMVSSYASSIGFGNGFNWTVRTGGDPRALLGPVQALLREMDPDLLLQNENTLEEIVRQSTDSLRFAMTLTSIFGVLALLLATVGIYGVLAYRVRQRRPELGMRLTFGAVPADIFLLVVRQGMTLVGIGLCIGLLATLVMSRTIQSLMVGINATDPVTYAIIIVLFALVALAACALPAWRATRVDPAVSLRYE